MALPYLTYCHTKRWFHRSHKNSFKIKNKMKAFIRCPHKNTHYLAYIIMDISLKGG